VSIELFLGRHNISKEDGSLIPVVWSNYVKSVGVYQDAMEDKQGPLTKSLQNTEQDGSSLDYCARFPELVILWDHIFDLLKWDSAKPSHRKI
jgi:hypothetical protein